MLRSYEEKSILSYQIAIIYAVLSIFLTNFAPKLPKLKK